MNPINDLAFAYRDAIFNRFLDIVYQDRDLEKYYAWKESIPSKEFNDLLKNERATGVRCHQESLITTRKRPSEYEVTLCAMFPQTWSSTALGFSGLGGQKITQAYTIIIECLGEYAVYFGSRFAYLVTNPKSEFFDDIKTMNMKSVKEFNDYY